MIMMILSSLHVFLGYGRLHSKLRWSPETDAPTLDGEAAFIDSHSIALSLSTHSAASVAGASRSAARFARLTLTYGLHATIVPVALDPVSSTG